MDAHEVQPRSPPRSRVRSRPSSWSSGGGVEYTSLCDVLAESRPGGGGGGGAVDSINTRSNPLKRAASACLQSAIVVSPRGRACLGRVWRRMLQRRRCGILLRPCGCAWPHPWPGCCRDRDPVHRCAASMAGPARRVVAFVARSVACLWA